MSKKTMHGRDLRVEECRLEIFLRSVLNDIGQLGVYLVRPQLKRGAAGGAHEYVPSFFNEENRLEQNVCLS